MKKKIKAWAVIVPGTDEPFTDLGLDLKDENFNAGRRFILPQKKSIAEGLMKVNGLLSKQYKNFGFKIVPVEITYSIPKKTK